MDASFITPFMTSIQNVFSTMFQLPVEIGEPRIKTDSKTSHDVSGIIGVSGEMVGTIVLSMPIDAAESIVALFTGMEMLADSDDFADAVGELINMISGNAKAEFQRKSVSISCPSVVIGAGHRVASSSNIPCVLIPCNTDCGEVVLEVALRNATETASTSTSTAA
ncbi:MAG: chemotaxis protein CheX [Phycisphaerales bacterium]|nr:chemotaxis protein CheX [Phycisphaerales bacterium]